MGYVTVEGEGEETELASQSHSGSDVFPRWAEERAWWAFPGEGRAGRLWPPPEGELGPPWWGQGQGLGLWRCCLAAGTPSLIL